jgi:hypothetical protein
MTLSARHSLPVLARFGATALAVLALGACSGSNGHSGGAVAGSGGGASASSAAKALGLGSGGPLDVSKLCAAVPKADVQKLFKATAPAVSANPAECDWGGGAITVDIFTNDGDKKYYNGGAVDHGTPISGIGDVAQWTQPVPDATVPVLAAHKGSTTITVSPGLDVADSTLQYTGSSPFYKIPADSALQYVVEEGKICNDLFAAAS